MHAQPERGRGRALQVLKRKREGPMHIHGVPLSKSKTHHT